MMLDGFSCVQVRSQLGLLNDCGSGRSPARPGVEAPGVEAPGYNGVLGACHYRITSCVSARLGGRRG